MEFFYYQEADIFAFPVNIITGLFLLLGIYTLHRHYSQASIVRWLTGMPATLMITGLLILILIIEGIWVLQLYKTYIFIVLEVLLLIVLGLVILKKVHSFSVRNILFLLNHAGLWIALSAALLGAPDREEYKMIAPLGQPEYNTVDAIGHLHPLPFTVCLNKFELEYYPQTENARIPKHFCSTLTLRSKDKEIQTTTEVNRPAHFKGYTLYQDGYDVSQGDDSQYSILLIVRDPWIGLVYTGIFMLLIGATGLIIYGPIKKQRL